MMEVPGSTPGQSRFSTVLSGQWTVHQSQEAGVQGDLYHVPSGQRIDAVVMGDCCWSCQRLTVVKDCCQVSYSLTSGC